MVHNMIRIFDKNATDFSTQGLGTLTEATSCKITEELNGAFDLELEYPVIGAKYSSIVRDNIIVAPTGNHKTRSEEQAFRIYSISRPLESHITVYAHHISYDQAKIPLKNFDTRSGAQNRASDVVSAAEAEQGSVKAIIDGILQTISSVFSASDEELSKEEGNGTDRTKAAYLLANQKCKVTGEYSSLVYMYPYGNNIATDVSLHPELKAVTATSGSYYQILGTFRKITQNGVDQTELGYTKTYQSTSSTARIYITIPVEGDADVSYQNDVLCIDKNYGRAGSEPNWVKIEPIDVKNINIISNVTLDSDNCYKPAYDGYLIIGRNSTIPITSVVSVKYVNKVLTFDRVIKLLSDNQIITDPAERARHPFTFTADADLINDESTLEDEREIKILTPTSLRSAIGEILNAYEDCDVEFDNFNVIFHKTRGSDKGVTLRYGKNITSFEMKDESESSYTHVYPYWFTSSTNTLVQLTVTEAGESAPFVKIDDSYSGTDMNVYLYDASSEFSSRPSRKQLLSKTNEFIKKHKFGADEISTRVSFTDLSKFENSEELAEKLYKVELGDVLRVVLPNKNINYSARCKKITYDVLLGEYSDIEIGEPEENLASIVASQSASLKKTTKYAATVAVSNADIARGINAGFTKSYVILNDKDPKTQISFDDDGYPNELIISSGTNLMTSGLWKWNKEGLAYYPSGYYSERTNIALTKDGLIDASAIQTGSFTIFDPSHMTDILFSADASEKKVILDIESPTGDKLLYVNSSASGSATDPRVYINADLITTKNLIIPSDNSDNPAYYLASFLASGGVTQPKALLDIRDATGKSLIYVNSGYTGNPDLDISEADPIVYVAGDNIVSGSITNALVKTSYISNGNYATEYFVETPTVTVTPTGFVATIHAERVDDATIIVFRGEYSSISCTITDAMDSSVTRTFVPTITFDNKRNVYYFVVPTYPEDASSGVGDIVELSLTGSGYTTENVVAWYESNIVNIDTSGHNYIITEEEAFINDFKKGGYSGIDGFWYESEGIQLINISKWKYEFDATKGYPYGIIFDEKQVPQYTDSVQSINMFVYTPIDDAQTRKGITIGGDTWGNSGRILLDGTKIELIASNGFNTSLLTLDPVNGTSCRLTNGIKIQNGSTALTAYDNTSSLTLAPGSNITFSYSNNTLVINSTGGSSGEFEGLMFVGFSESGTRIIKTYTPDEAFMTAFNDGIVAVSDPASGGDVSFGLSTDWLSSRYIPHDGGVVSVDLSFRGYTTVKDLTVTGPIVGQNGLSVIGGIRGALANAISLQSGGGFYTIFDNTAPLTIAAGSNITFSYSNNTLTINSTGGGGGGGGGDYLPLIGGTLTGAVDGPKFVSTGTTDSANSTDNAAALVTYGGLTVKKNASVKAIRIDNGSTSKGCSLVFNESENCLNFVFSN